MSNRTEDVILAALVTQIEVQAKRITELEAEGLRRKGRQWDLRVALHNLLTLDTVAEDPRSDRYRRVLDADNDQ